MDESDRNTPAPPPSAVETPLEPTADSGGAPAHAPAPPSTLAALGDRAAGRLQKLMALGSRARAVLSVTGGAALLVTVVAMVAAKGTPKLSAQATSTHSVERLPAMVSQIEASAPAPSGSPQPDAGSAQPGMWRVSQLVEDSNVSLVQATIGHRPLLVALTGAGLSSREAQRVVRSLSDVRNVDRFGPRDSFAVARDKSGHILAYEVTTSPTDAWQARAEPQADGFDKLVARKLELWAEHVRVRTAVLVGSDLRASLAEAGISPVDDEFLTMLDDALSGRAELSEIRPGSRLRIIATQERVSGTFVRWLSLDAVEYLPMPQAPATLRVYWFGDDETGRKHHGWFDAKGRQPLRGGWRLPLPLARVVSRFNPRRMHPILHVVMPHNGVDLAAPSGTPVYATAAGVVTSMGPDGPCGNKVEIGHPRGMKSIYCHLSRFAPGLSVGDRVEQRQLIAYVGQTGRVTGPHLHFGIRQGDVFIDPMTLHLDGVRVVPRAQRDRFDRQRAELDAELDSIGVPAAPASMPIEAPEVENLNEESP